eukprot:jgi/Chrzof1/7316/Cz02g19050.t1
MSVETQMPESPQASAPLTVADVIKQELSQNDIDPSTRSRMADDTAFAWSRPIREACPDDKEVAAAVNDLITIPEAKKQQLWDLSDKISNKVAEAVARKQLELNGLDPSTADHEAAREVLRRPLSPQEQEALNAEYNKVVEEVYEPLVREALQDMGVEVEDDSTSKLWQKFETNFNEKYGQPKAKQHHIATIAVPSVLLGALAAVGIARLVSWLKRVSKRRQPPSNDEHHNEVGP